MKFRDQELLQPHLLKLFDKICVKKKHMSRREMLKVCEDFGDLTETDKGILAVKKLSNVMKYTKW